IKHNNRKMNEKEKARNSHIDFSRSDKNKYLQQDSIRDLYKREFGGALEKYNAKQKRNDRKIDDYYKHIEKGKKKRNEKKKNKKKKNKKKKEKTEKLRIIKRKKKKKKKQVRNRK